MNDVISLRQAADLLGINYVTARQWAVAGDFPGLITTRQSGKRRLWLVSVPRFEAEVHGRSGPCAASKSSDLQGRS